MTRMPTYFISHGGGPWPWLDGFRQNFVQLENALARIPDELPARPKAVLMISGHWETDQFSVMTNPHPPMVYDYYNFPAHTYQIVYPAPGAPEVSARAMRLLQSAGLSAREDTEQGFDHGTFVPMFVMYPQADIPLFQISIEKSYDPQRHLALGRALAPLRDEGVLIVGSGLSYHNLALFGPGAQKPSSEFDAWLNDKLDSSPDERTAAMIDWEAAPSARVAHAQEDHLVPLWVALGAAEQAKATRVYHQTGILGGVTASSWRFD